MLEYSAMGTINTDGVYFYRPIMKEGIEQNMEIVIRSRFDNVEAAETCIKRIREARLRVKEITLLPPQHLRDNDHHHNGVIPIISNSYPGGVGYGSGIFALSGVNFDGTEDKAEDDIISSDATVEVVADSIEKDKLRSIIVNSGGRDTEVY